MGFCIYIGYLTLEGEVLHSSLIYDQGLLMSGINSHPSWVIYFYLFGEEYLKH